MPGSTVTGAAAHLMPEELRAGAEHVWQQALQQSLKAFPVGGWDAVPCLGSATVQVVHAGKVHVLSVPAPEITLAEDDIGPQPNTWHV